MWHPPAVTVYMVHRQRVAVFSFAVSPGTWPGGAWVPGGPRPCFVCCCFSSMIQILFVKIFTRPGCLTFHSAKGLRPNSRIMHRFFTSHQPMMNFFLLRAPFGQYGPVAAFELYLYTAVDSRPGPGGSRLRYTDKAQVAATGPYWPKGARNKKTFFATFAGPRSDPRKPIGGQI